MSLPEPVQTISSLLPFATLAATIVLAWYVNSALKQRFQREDFIERQLKDFYRPMDILLRSGLSAFKRYSRAGDDEKKTIAELWYNNYKVMKETLLKNSHLIDELRLPPVIARLLLHIDAYSFEYEQYKRQQVEDPFPVRRGIPFPADANEYFAEMCEVLIRRLPRGRRSLLRRPFSSIRK